MSHFTFDRGILLSLAGLVSLLVVNAVVSYRNIWQLNEDAGWVVHTHEVMDALGEVDVHLREAEAIERNYLITGGNAVPAAYSENIDAAKQKVAELKSLTRDNPDQQAHIPELNKRLEELIAAWSRIMSIRKEQGLDAIRQTVQTGQSDKPLRELQMLIGQMDQAERNLLRNRQLRSARSYSVAVVTGAVTAALGVAAVATFIWLLDSHLRGRQRAAAVIHQQRQLLQATLTSVGDAVIATDTEGRVTFLNPVAEHLTGWSGVEAAGMPLEKVFEIVNETTLQRVPNPVFRALREGRIVGLANHTVLIAKDGSKRPIDDSAAPIRDTAGVVAGAVLVFRDVTDKRRTEMALRASEERLGMALDAAQLGFWDWDVSTGDVLWNRHHETIFGYTPGQPKRTYRHFADRVPPEDLQRIEAGFREAVQEKREYRFEHRVVWPDGTVRWIEAYGRFHFDTNGQAARSVGVVIDISVRRRLEDELRKLAADLSEANRRKDEFLAVLAHELRNPLAPIRNALQILGLSDDSQSVAQARIMMDRQLSQVVRLVDDLMDMSRIGQGKLDLRKERVALEAVVNSAVETSRPLIEEMGHALTITLPQVPVHLHADFARMVQVFLNLLNNAAKYTERGGHIWLTAELLGSEVVVTVKDNGIGIQPDMLRRLFQMFTQLDRAQDRTQGGLGIGLTLVKQLVEMHGGTVEARSEGLGKGSQFVVRLPVVGEEVQPEAPGEKKTAAERSSLRILIVDDNRDGADSLSTMLRLMSNETATAYDGESALAVSKEFRPDVVLLDIGLPILNGLETCRLLRQQPDGKELVIIAQTGWGQQEDRQRAQDAGFDYHLVKPVDPSALMALLSGLRRRSAPAGN